MFKCFTTNTSQGDWSVISWVVSGSFFVNWNDIGFFRTDFCWKIKVRRGLAVSFSSLGGILSGAGALWTSRSSNSFCTPKGSMFSKGISGIGSLSIVGSEVKFSLVNTNEK